MAEHYISRKINFADLQVGDIVADKHYKHISEVLTREEVSVPDSKGTPNIVQHGFENAVFSTPLTDPDPIKVWAHTKVQSG